MVCERESLTKKLVRSWVKWAGLNGRKNGRGTGDEESGCA